MEPITDVEDVSDSELLDAMAGVANRITIASGLACATAVALRGVLPWAQQEVNRQQEVARTGGDDTLQEETDAGSAAIVRGYNALRAVDRGIRPIHDLPDDAYDDTINCYFDESIPEPEVVVETIAQVLIKSKATAQE